MVVTGKSHRPEDEVHSAAYLCVTYSKFLRVSKLLRNDNFAAYYFELL